MAVFAESLEARCQVENEDVVGAAPTGDAPTTSEWSTILLPTEAHLILEILRYIKICHSQACKLLNFPHQLSSTDLIRYFVLIGSVKIPTYGMFHSSCDKLIDTNE